EVNVGKAVVINESQIEGIDAVDSLSGEMLTIDVGGRYISPGLIDIHTHGALSHTFNEPTVEAWKAITCENAKRGVSSLLATIATAPIPDIVRCLEFSQEWMSSPREGTRVIGVHLEGPYFSHGQRGAQDPKNLRNPDDGSVDEILEHHGVLRL